MRVRVAPLYLVLLAWWVAGGYFSEIALALLALACHECAHLLVLSGYDVGISSLDLHPFGASINYQAPPEGLGPVEAVVAAAGPLQSLLLAAIATYVEPLGWLAADRVRLFGQFNLVLGCFNLLPVWPLDGGRIARAWLAPRLGDGEAQRLLARWGRRLGLAIAAAGVLASIVARGPLWVPVAGGGLLWRAARPDARAGQQALVRSLTRRGRRLRGGIGPAALLVARPTARLSQVLQRLRSDRYSLLIILDERGGRLGELTEEQCAAALLALGVTADLGAALRHASAGPDPPPPGAQPPRDAKRR